MADIVEDDLEAAPASPVSPARRGEYTFKFGRPAPSPSILGSRRAMTPGRHGPSRADLLRYAHAG